MPEGMFIAPVIPDEKLNTMLDAQTYLENGGYRGPQETVLKPGVKVLIADKECAITLHRRTNEEKKLVIKEQGYLPRQEKMNINEEACEYCLECTRGTG